MDGIDDIIGAIGNLRNRIYAAAAAAADESAKLVENYAKIEKPYRDRTGNLRSSTRGTSLVTRDLAKVVVSASMEYAPKVEVGSRRSRPYPFLWPAIANNTDRMRSIFARHMRL